MSSEPSQPGETVRIRAVHNDDRSDALRKIARACIAIARQQLDQDAGEKDRAENKTATSTAPPPGSNVASNENPEADHA